jgi:hypothetical protein
MWQCHTYSPGRSKVATMRVTWPGRPARCPCGPARWAGPAPGRR